MHTNNDLRCTLIKAIYYMFNAKISGHTIFMTSVNF